MVAVKTSRPRKASSNGDDVYEGNRPVPDPTVLTTRLVDRAYDRLRDMGDKDKEIIETRLAGMDKAIELLEKRTAGLPDQIKDEVNQLKELHSERFSSLNVQSKIRFASIATQFTERDKRTEQLSLADKTAIAAALQAQKEAAAAQNESNTTANNKMEGNFAKLIDTQQEMLRLMIKSTDEKFIDMKGRQDRGEGHTKGTADLYGWAIAAVMALVAIGALATTVVIAMKP